MEIKSRTSHMLGKHTKLVVLEEWKLELSSDVPIHIYEHEHTYSWTWTHIRTHIHTHTSHAKDFLRGSKVCENLSFRNCPNWTWVPNWSRHCWALVLVSFPVSAIRHTDKSNSREEVFIFSPQFQDTVHQVKAKVVQSGWSSHLQDREPCMHPLLSFFILYSPNPHPGSTSINS